MDTGLLVATAICIIVIIIVVKMMQGVLRRHRIQRRGKAGEKSVSRELSRYRKRGVHVLNDILVETVAGHTSQVDHIVVCRSGIFVIETKSHTGRISGGEYSQYWEQEAGDYTYVFYNPLLQNDSHIRSLRKLMPELPEILWKSIIVFTSASDIRVSADDIIKERKILPDRHIRRTFQPEFERKIKWWQIFHKGDRVVLDEEKRILTTGQLVKDIEERDHLLTSKEADAIAGMIRKNIIEGRREHKLHVEYAKEIAKSTEKDIQKGRCPRCGGYLIRMEGEHGIFYGCSEYPRCRFTCKG